MKEEVIANLYWNQIANVRCKDELTEEIVIGKGVRKRMCTVTGSVQPV